MVHHGRGNGQPDLGWFLTPVHSPDASDQEINVRYVNRPQTAVIQCLEVCQTLQNMACLWVSSMQPINLQDHSCIVAVAQMTHPL